MPIASPASSLTPAAIPIANRMTEIASFVIAIAKNAISLAEIATCDTLPLSLRRARAIAWARWLLTRPGGIF
jgi:hypothetical protein